MEKMAWTIETLPGIHISAPSENLSVQHPAPPYPFRHAKT